MLRSLGKGVKVVLLGGGIAGLVAAYELRLGYECTVLEAREQTGRTELDGARRRQGHVSGRHDADLHLGRGTLPELWTGALPSVHQTMLGYCQKLGVPLEVEVNMTAPPSCKTITRTAASRWSCARWKMIPADM